MGGGVHQLEPGEWTDDTSMALCLAESLLQANGFDPTDQMKRYVKWFREGYLSSKDHCFDIGNATRDALLSFEKTGRPYAGSADPWSAGNGSIMRLAPVPLFYAEDPALALEMCARSSATTHAAKNAVDASLIKGSGYVVESLEAALWAFHHSSSFEEGLLLAVNLGDDADTTGAVYGQLAGAYYGMEGLPPKMCAIIKHRKLIEAIAVRLYQNRYHPSRLFP